MSGLLIYFVRDWKFQWLNTGGLEKAPAPCLNIHARFRPGVLLLMNNRPY